MKKTLVIFMWLAVIFSGCHKSNSNTDIPAPTSVAPKTYNITLNADGSGSAVKLTWSKLDVDGFNGYYVYRSEDDSAPFVEVFRINDKQQTSCIDNDVPFKASVRYKVTAGFMQTGYVESNVVNYNRADLKVVDITPNNIIYNKEDQLFYIIQRHRYENGSAAGGVVYIYDLAKNEITKSVKMPAILGFAGLGIYNGKRELYVPGDGGAVFVLDAITLDKITEIKTGLSNYSVLYHKNNLYISTSAPVARDPIKVISRATGNQVSAAGFFPTTRLVPVPNTDLHLLEITSINTSPVGQAYYKFLPDGSYVIRTEDKYHEDRIADDRIVEFFTDGSKYITTSAGLIYTSNMEKSATLPRGDLNFTSFAFDQTAPVIYGATRTRTIEAYSFTNYEKLRSYSTSAYPFKIFDMGNYLLCFSVVAKNKPYPNEMPSDLLGMHVEKIVKQ